MIAYLRFILLAGAIVNSCAGAAEPVASRQVDVAKLQSGEVAIIGKLGRELGTVLAVEVVIIAAPDAGMLKPVRYLMQVVSVEGAPLATPVVLPFEIYPGVAHNLPASESELKERAKSLIAPEQLRPPGPIGREEPERLMSAAEAARFIRDYVGSKHRLLAMEVVDIRGALKVLPPGVWKVDMPRFGVHPSLVVLREDF